MNAQIFMQIYDYRIKKAIKMGNKKENVKHYPIFLLLWIQALLRCVFGLY